MTVSEDGSEYILRIPRNVFVERGGLPKQKLPISARQREVLGLLWQNKSNKEIASALHVTVRTVKFHVSSLLAAYDVDSRTALVMAVHRLSTTPD